MHRSEKIIEDLTGQKMAGHRAPGGVIHDYSLELFLEHGYIYSSNWRDSDGPFLHQIDGKTVPLVELPKDSIFDDTAYVLHRFRTGTIRTEITGRNVRNLERGV